MSAWRSLFDEVEEEDARPSGRAPDAAPADPRVPQPSLIRRANGRAFGEGNGPAAGAALLPLVPVPRRHNLNGEVETLREMERLDRYDRWDAEQAEREARHDAIYASDDTPWSGGIGREW